MWWTVMYFYSVTDSRFIFYKKQMLFVYKYSDSENIVKKKNDILPPRRVHFKHPFKKQNYSQNNSLTNSLLEQLK